MSMDAKCEVVTICGSMRFENEMKRIAFILEAKHNMTVLQCVYNEDMLDITEEEIDTLNRSHFKKIEMSDAIYVVNIDRYIGEQVKKEIAFADYSRQQCMDWNQCICVTGSDNWQ